MNIKQDSISIGFSELLPLLQAKDNQLYTDICEFLNDNARFVYECVGYENGSEIFEDGFAITNTAITWGNPHPQKQKSETAKKAGFSHHNAWSHIEREYNRIQEDGLSPRRLMYAIKYHSFLEQKGLTGKEMPFFEWFENRHKIDGCVETSDKEAAQ